MELVSPILDFQDHSKWNKQMDDVWWVLQEKFNTSTDTHCSTHVHISPAEGQWTLDQVKRVAKAALYFEQSVDTILPTHRSNSTWAKSNRNNTSLKDKDMNELFSLIDSKQDVDEIVCLMCSCSRNSLEGISMGRSLGLPQYNMFRWNFTPLTRHSMGTIEFRQPPGSEDAASTKLWVTFAVSFVQAAITSAHTLDSARLPVLEDLRTFMLNGVVQSYCHRLDQLLQLPPAPRRTRRERIKRRLSNLFRVFKKV